MDTKVKCPKCGAELPPFNEKGNHNFCPTNDENGEIISVCMKCKMGEILEKWKREKK